MQFSLEQTSDFKRLSRGYQGEVQFAELLDKELHQPCIPIFDLRLKVFGSECQFDCLLMFQQYIHLFEVKNFQGDYIIDGDRWFSRLTMEERKNPLFQLRRSDLLLRDFLAKQPFNVGVESHVVFVNPEFYLYQAPPDSPIIFPGQQQRYTQELNQTQCQLHQQHHRLADQLKAGHIPKSTHEQFPEYEYDQLKKGIVCTSCDGFMEKVSQRRLLCPFCGLHETVEDAVIRTVKEFRLLFPERPIKVSAIQNWSNHVLSDNNIRTCLDKYVPLLNKGRSSYYQI
jgi:hypothetical protein